MNIGLSGVKQQFWREMGDIEREMLSVWRDLHRITREKAHKVIRWCRYA
ncbi:hypothetical protein [Bacillus marinisedimentorum]|nr:hypothetical protein [Bacillus marinisedimentorum]